MNSPCHEIDMKSTSYVRKKHTWTRHNTWTMQCHDCEETGTGSLRLLHEKQQ